MLLFLGHMLEKITIENSNNTKHKRLVNTLQTKYLESVLGTSNYNADRCRCNFFFPVFGQIRKFTEMNLIRRIKKYPDYLYELSRNIAVNKWQWYLSNVWLIIMLPRQCSNPVTLYKLNRLTYKAGRKLLWSYDHYIP